MKIIYTIFTLFFLSLNIINAQESSYFEEILNEKIPNIEVKEYLKTIKEKSDFGLDYKFEISAIEKLISENAENTQGSKTLSDNDFGVGAEPFITINPNNPDNIAVAFMIQSGMTLSMPVYTSIDGGVTWIQSDFDTNAILDEMLGATALGGGDPVLAFDPNGRLHITWLLAYMSGFNIRMALFYAYSDDEGATIIIPPLNQHMLYDADILNGEAIDRQWMAADFSGGEYADNLYISALAAETSLSASGEVILIKDIINIDEDFETTLVVPFVGNTSTQFGNVKIDDDGNVHMACITISESTQSGNIMYNKSTDGGQTFSTTELSEISSTFPNGGNIPMLVHSRENTATSMAVDGQNIYIAWTDMSNQTIKSYYLYSNDSGDTWSDPIEYGPTIVDGDNYHLMPNLSADNGRMTIAWYVVDTETLVADYWYVESQDGGETLIMSQIISDGSTDFTGESTSANFFGDYNTSDSNGCLTYTIWSDGNSGSPQVYVSILDGCAVGIAETTIIGGTFSIKSLYPNPITTELNVQINSDQKDEFEIRIYSLDGKQMLFEYNINVNQGVNKLHVSGLNLSSGNYLLKVTNQKGQYNTRVISVE